MTERLDLVQEYILEKIEKYADESGAEYRLRKWTQVLAWYGDAKK